MGHTHYHTQNSTVSKLRWESITGATKRVLEYTRETLEIPLDVESDGNEDHIFLNGVDDDAYETFVVNREGEGFAFCKTERKPYDVTVGLILLVLNELAPGCFEISSDGYWKGDWDQIRAAYRELFHDEPSCPWEK